MSPTRLLPSLALLATLLPPQAALALPSDRDQPIQIEADRAAQDQKQGITTYSGAVTMDQGSIHIEADQVVIYSANKKVVRIVATGQPARFRQLPEPDKAPVTARGNQLDYQVSQDRLLIQLNAEVEQAGSLVSGHAIDYDIRQALVQASSDQEGKARVKMVLQPQGANTESVEPEPAPETRPEAER